MYMQILTIGADTGTEFLPAQTHVYPKNLVDMKNLIQTRSLIPEAATKHQSMTVSEVNEPLVGPIYTWIEAQKSKFVFTNGQGFQTREDRIEIEYMYQAKVNLDSQHIVLHRVYGGQYVCTTTASKTDLYVTKQTAQLIYNELRRRLPTTGTLLAKSNTVYWATPFLIIRSSPPDTYYVGSATPIPLLPKELTERKGTYGKPKDDE